MAYDHRWGAVQHSDTLAPGIRQVSTAGHGGIIVDDAVLATMPAPLRLPHGIYEEDCDWSLVALAFPHLFKPEVVESAKATAKNYHPDRYMQHTGETLTEADSYILAKRAHTERIKGAWEGVSASGDWHKTVPEGYVGVHIRHTETSEERTILVPATEYRSRGDYSWFTREPDKYVPWLHPYAS
jgi:hypothetical protein